MADDTTHPDVELTAIPGGRPDLGGILREAEASAPGLPIRLRISVQVVVGSKYESWPGVTWILNVAGAARVMRLIDQITAWLHGWDGGRDA